MIRKTVLAGAVSAFAMVGSALSAATVDLGIIMDSSGSIAESDFDGAMNALANAIDANIPVGGVDTYRISVVAFSTGASTVVAATNVTSGAIRTNVSNAIRNWASNNSNNTSGLTNYAAALNLINGNFGNVSGSKASLINMMTDGQPNEPGTNAEALAAAKTAATNLQNGGWDSLSFESVGNSAGNSLLAGLGFGPGNTPTDANLLPIYTSAAQIGDPLTTPFVLDLPNFAAYNSVIGSKIQKIVTPDPIPVPAALPLLIGGLGVFAFVGRRRRKAA